MDFKRQIAIGDVHGQIDLLINLVEDVISFKPDDQLIFLGDYIDRSPNVNEVKVLEYINELNRRYQSGNIITLLGNHEDMAWIFFQNSDKYHSECWWYNGGNSKNWKEDPALTLLQKFISQCKLFHETDTHIFVHAGATEWALRNPTTEEAKSILLWERTGNQQRCFNKRLVVGHTRQHSVLIDDHRICVDTGAYRSGLLSAYDVKNSLTYCSYKKWTL